MRLEVPSWAVCCCALLSPWPRGLFFSQPLRLTPNGDYRTFCVGENMWLLRRFAARVDEATPSASNGATEEEEEEEHECEEEAADG